MIHIKSEREIEIMRNAGHITALILKSLGEAVTPGITTKDLDQIAEKKCKEYKVKPAFKGYHGFPACLCASINNEVVHGIPSNKMLSDGDIISLDFGVIYDGYFGDSAITVPCGKVSQKTLDLIETTKNCMFEGIKQAVSGNKLFDISYSIQKYVEDRGYAVVREFVGHGIGKNLHEDPQVPNFGPKGKGITLKEGMVLAIEPMINAGTHAVRVESDGWTAVTVDGSMSAHFEHTIAICANGPEILTLA